MSDRKKAGTVCFRRVRNTYPEWGLKKLKEGKQVMYVGNMQVHHRNWNGPSLIQIVGTKGTTHPVRIEDVGEIKLFCVTDNNGTRSDHAWVIPDREVLVRYTDASTRVMAPAFLLCMNSSDDWLHMLKNDKRESTWKSHVFPEGESEDKHKSPETAGAGNASCQIRNCNGEGE